MSYGDVETLLIDWIAATYKTSLGLVMVVPEVELPSNLTYCLPLVTVGRFGGGDDTISLDVANVDVDVYAATAGAAKTIARRIHTGVRLNLPGHLDGSLSVSRARTITAPTVRDYQSSTVFLVGASYQVTAHSHALAD